MNFFCQINFHFQYHGDLTLLLGLVVDPDVGEDDPDQGQDDTETLIQTLIQMWISTMIHVDIFWLKRVGGSLSADDKLQCLFACLFLCLSVCLSACLALPLVLCVPVCVCVYVPIYVRTHTSACVCVCVCACVRA